MLRWLPIILILLTFILIIFPKLKKYYLGRLPCDLTVILFKRTFCLPLGSTFVIFLIILFLANLL